MSAESLPVKNGKHARRTVLLSVVGGLALLWATGISNQVIGAVSFVWSLGHRVPLLEEQVPGLARRIEVLEEPNKEARALAKQLKATQEAAEALTEQLAVDAAERRRERARR